MSVSLQCDLIFICVDKTENVENVVFGENGIVKNASKKTIIVDLSTTSADKTMIFSRNLELKKEAPGLTPLYLGGLQKH